jgi:outer membrane protein insertion porin family
VRCRLGVGIWSLGVLLAPASSYGQQPAAAAYVDRPVASVKIEIEGHPSAEPGLEEAIQTRTGAPLKMADVRNTIAHLYSLGRFEDIQVEAEAAPDGGVALRYALSPVHTVTRVIFKGELGLSEGRLRGRMTERFGAAPPLARAADVAAALEELYHERGYLHASVKTGSPIVEHDPDRATLVFDVNAGTRTIIGRSSITGRPLEPVAAIQARLEILPGQPYQPGEIRERLANYVSALRRRHYYEATGTPQTPVISEDGTRADVTVDIQPGPLVTIEFTGDPLPKDKIAELVPIEREGSVDQDLQEDSARRIQDYLNQLGYYKADVAPPERQEADGRLTLVFHVKRGQLYRVAPGGVEVTGNHSVPIEELRPLLKMAPGEVFVSSKLGAISSAITQLYKQRGFASVQVDSALNEAGDGLVKPAIAIKEGARVLVGAVAVTGNETVPADRLKPLLKLATGDPYFGPLVARDRDAILTTYLDAGYASADVKVAPVVPTVTPEGARADVTFTIVEGPQTIVEHIFITGNLRTKPSIIQRELQVKAGGPLGLEDLTESKRRLSALGLFRRIQVSTISHGDPSLRDLVVFVEEAPQTTIGAGGGLEMDRRLRQSTVEGTPTDQFEFAPRGFFEIGRRNLGGRDRSVNLYTRLSLRPSSNPANRSLFGFPEYRVVGTYREPRALRSYGDLVATVAVEQGVRTGFNFARKGFNAELSHRLTPTIRGSARYSLSTTRVRDLDESQLNTDILTVDRVFPQVRLSTFYANLARDTRDDVLDPQQGTLISADGTLAARSIGSELGFSKTFLQGFVYRNLGRPHLVLAAGARLGLAKAFLRIVQSVDENGNPRIDEVRDLPVSERFFAGGDTTIRGFSLDSVGVPATISSTGFPKGGDAEIILNAELRAPLYKKIGVVLFADGGNVFARAADLSLTELRGSLGFGLRYRSAIGAIRFDLGFKLDRRRIGTKLEPPYAFHFSIGQAF